MDYRREIDGLRAVAVLPVILFHAGFQAFSGGFIGVDVFFLISGYLITTIILAEQQAGTFSLVKFYERRARRILPALYLVIAICIPFAWMLLSRYDLSSFSKSLVAISVFSSNIFFWRDDGYFDTAAELKPLLHTWSLAVEEEYYVLFPIFIMLTWKLGKRWTVSLLLAIAVISLLAAQWGANHRPVATFFLLPTRAWELAGGALIAFYYASKIKINIPSKAQQLLSIAGLLLIVYAVFAFDKATPSPGVYTLVPTLGAALIILFATPATLVGFILGSKIFVGVGLISYSAYLWHQPLFAFARNYSANPSSELMLGLSVSALILAVFSWKFVEQPFRAPQRFSRGVVFSFSGICSIALVAFGLASASLFGSSSGAGTEPKLASALTQHNVVFASNMNERRFIKSRIQCENLNPNVIVVGSSRIMQIGQHNFKDKVLNLGMNGSSVEDDIAIVDMATKKFKPKTLLIGVDPWLFNSESGQDGWKSLEAEYHQAIISIKSGQENSSIKPDIADSDGALKWFLAELGNNIYQYINRTKLIAEDDKPGTKDKIRRDGSRVYNTSRAKQSPAEIERGFDRYLNYAMGTYRFSENLKDDFEIFLDHHWKKHNIVLILSPYHPKLFDRMKSEREIYLDIESQFRDLANRKGITIIGSYDPGKVGCREDEFYDGMHPKDVCMERVISELRRLQVED